MKKRLIAATLAFFALTTLPACSKEMKSQETGSQIMVPDFTLPDLSGRPVTLSSFRNQKPVLLVFWATWCSFCKQEMPNIVALQDKYGDRLQVLSVDIQESQSKVFAYASKNNFNFPTLLDEEGDVASQYGIAGVPTLVLVDKQGMGIVAENALNSRLLQAIEKTVG